jgi:hypothetical protein
MSQQNLRILLLAKNAAQRCGNLGGRLANRSLPDITAAETDGSFAGRSTVTCAGADLSARAARSPPNPPPTMTTRGLLRSLSVVFASPLLAGWKAVRVPLPELEGARRSQAKG